MALTRIGSVGLATGIDINAGVGTFTGNLTVGGVLTYEDVTNVDSIGLITARNGVVVGSGITLSSDGDIFFTGIMTGNGSGLTGVANTDVIFADKISFPDSSAGSINVGLSSDLSIYHDGSNSYIKNTTGDLIIWDDTILKFRSPKYLFNNQADDENIIVADQDGAVELYYNHSKKLETTSGGVTVTGAVSATSFTGDGTNLTNVGVDTAVVFTDKITLPDSSGAGSINVGLGSDLQIYHDGSNSFIRDTTGTNQTIIDGAGGIDFRHYSTGDLMIRAVGNGQVEIYHDNTKTADTISEGFRVSGLLFGSDTAAANKLDDYEEGTFTPTVLNGWGYLNSNPTISQGKYVRIGAIVYIYFTFQEGSGTGASSNANGLSLYNLPFNADGSYGSGGGNNYSEPLTAFADSASSGAENIFGLHSSNGLSVFMFRKMTSTGRGVFSGSNLGTGTVFCSGVYRISGT